MSRKKQVTVIDNGDRLEIYINCNKIINPNRIKIIGQKPTKLTLGEK